ncbi:hypothetical protein SLS62_003778 [Diatrype stigma]|uniref:Uncharacterized protein n=1 Tax=Diatrype stigma TaxID=117547 RepID=A0AAN9UVE5_9PEZI
MPDWKGLAKNGWHPEKDSSSGSTSNSITGLGVRSSVKGFVGRGDDSRTSSIEHRAQPASIHSLRDPSSFGPPPKRTTATIPPPSPAGGSASSALSSPSHSPYPTSNAIAPAPPARNHALQAPATIARGGREEEQQQYHHHQQQQEPTPEPRPYRVNTTGLQTSHLPPPPKRRDDGSGGGGGGLGGNRPPPPSLPPRLPPRGASTNGAPSPTATSSPSSSSPVGGSRQPPPQSYQLNQGAMDRLGAAGVSVPGLGIGAGGGAGAGGGDALGRLGKAAAAASFGNGGGSGGGGGRPPPPARPTSTPGGNAQMGELQTRFARLGASAAISHAQGSTPTPTSDRIATAIGKKPAPPPPPKKKPTLSGPNTAAAGGGDAPPPVPLATRPKFG